MSHLRLGQDEGDTTQKRGWPEPVRNLRRRAYETDGILFAFPESNHGVAGPAKNAFDWI